MLLRSQGRRHRSGPRAKLCHGTNAQPAACHRRPGRASLPCNEPRSLLTLQTKSPRWHISRLSAAGHRHASPSGGGWRPNKTQGSACPLAHVGGFPGLRHSGNQKRNCGLCKAEERRSPVQKPSLRAGLVTQVRGLLALKGKRPCPIGLPPLARHGIFDSYPWGLMALLCHH